MKRLELIFANCLRPTLRACGAMANASVYGAEDCRFESCQARFLFFFSHFYYCSCRGTIILIIAIVWIIMIINFVPTARYIPSLTHLIYLSSSLGCKVHSISIPSPILCSSATLNAKKRTFVRIARKDDSPYFERLRLSQHS